MGELHDEADRRAQEARTRLGLTVEPVPDIVETLEKFRLIVFVQSWTGGPLGAYLPRDDHQYVFLNGREYLPRFRFTAAHELAHHVYRDGPQLDVSLTPEDVIEERANAFAVAFLVPRAGIAARLGPRRRRPDAEDVLNLATHFGVSYETTTYRLHNTQVINAATRDKLMRDRTAVLSSEFRHRHADFSYLPAEYVERALRAYASDRVDFDRLAELLRAQSQAERSRLIEMLHSSQLLNPEDDPARTAAR